MMLPLSLHYAHIASALAACAVAIADTNVSQSPQQSQPRLPTINSLFNGSNTSASRHITRAPNRPLFPLFETATIYFDESADGDTQRHSGIVAVLDQKESNEAFASEQRFGNLYTWWDARKDKFELAVRDFPWYDAELNDRLSADPLAPKRLTAYSTIHKIRAGTGAQDEARVVIALLIYEYPLTKVTSRMITRGIAGLENYKKEQLSDIRWIAGTKPFGIFTETQQEYLLPQARWSAQDIACIYNSRDLSKHGIYDILVVFTNEEADKKYGHADGHTAQSQYMKTWWAAVLSRELRDETGAEPQSVLKRIETELNMRNIQNAFRYKKPKVELLHVMPAPVKITNNRQESRLGFLLHVEADPMYDSASITRAVRIGFNTLLNYPKYTSMKTVGVDDPFSWLMNAPNEAARSAASHLVTRDYSLLPTSHQVLPEIELRYIGRRLTALQKTTIYIPETKHADSLPPFDLVIVLDEDQSKQAFQFLDAPGGLPAWWSRWEGKLRKAMADHPTLNTADEKARALAIVGSMRSGMVDKVSLMKRGTLRAEFEERLAIELSISVKNFESSPYHEFTLTHTTYALTTGLLDFLNRPHFARNEIGIAGSQDPVYQIFRTRSDGRTHVVNPDSALRPEHHDHYKWWKATLKSVLCKDRLQETAPFDIVFVFSREHSDQVYRQNGAEDLQYKYDLYNGMISKALWQNTVGVWWSEKLNEKQGTMEKIKDRLSETNMPNGGVQLRKVTLVPFFDEAKGRIEDRLGIVLRREKMVNEETPREAINKAIKISFLNLLKTTDHSQIHTIFKTDIVGWLLKDDEPTTPGPEEDTD